MRELRCSGCGVLLGYTRRSQAVPAQCLDPFCAVQPPVSANEERDSLIEHLFVTGVSPERIGVAVGLTRQRVAKVLASR